MLALLLAAPASGWEHNHRVWSEANLPILYRVADDGSPNSIEACRASDGWEGCCEETVPAGYCRDAAQRAFGQWLEGGCHDLSAAYDGICSNYAPIVDYRTSIVFNDGVPGPSSITEAGTLAVTYTTALGTAFVVDGDAYLWTVDADIVFNDWVPFSTEADIVAGRCEDAVSFDALMLHEVGHLLGLDHSCEDPNKGGEPTCVDPERRGAAMYWSLGLCESIPSPTPDDLAGLDALYGPRVDFACSGPIGVVPFDLRCALASDDLAEVRTAAWAFGDGGSATGAAVTHTYTEPGLYTVQVTADGEDPTCDPPTWTRTARKTGYVQACGAPAPAFEVEHVDRLRYQLLNESDLSVHGCVSAIEWHVYRGEDASGEPALPPSRSWEPEIEFPEPGTYTVVLNLGGMGGTTAAKVVLDVRDTRGPGYGCAQAPGTGLGGLAAALLARRRRGSRSGR